LKTLENLSVARTDKVYVHVFLKNEFAYIMSVIRKKNNTIIISIVSLDFINKYLLSIIQSRILKNMAKALAVKISQA
jgi:uncharacterized protein YjaZ